MCYRWCATACPKQLFNMLTQSMPQQWHRGHNACSKSLLPTWSMQLRVTAMHIYSSKHLKGSFEGTCPHVCKTLFLLRAHIPGRRAQIRDVYILPIYCPTCNKHNEHNNQTIRKHTIEVSRKRYSVYRLKMQIYLTAIAFICDINMTVANNFVRAWEHLWQELKLKSETW